MFILSQLEHLLLTSVLILIHLNLAVLFLKAAYPLLDVLLNFTVGRAPLVVGNISELLESLRLTLRVYLKMLSSIFASP